MTADNHAYVIDVERPSGKIETSLAVKDGPYLDDRGTLIFEETDHSRWAYYYDEWVSFTVCKTFNETE